MPKVVKSTAHARSVLGRFPGLLETPERLRRVSGTDVRGLLIASHAILLGREHVVIGLPFGAVGRPSFKDPQSARVQRNDPPASRFRLAHTHRQTAVEEVHLMPFQGLNLATAEPGVESECHDRHECPGTRLVAASKRAASSLGESAFPTSVNAGSIFTSGWRPAHRRCRRRMARRDPTSRLMVFGDAFSLEATLLVVSDILGRDVNEEPRAENWLQMFLDVDLLDAMRLRG